MDYVAIRASKGDMDALALIKTCIKTDEEYSAFANELFDKLKLK